MIPPTAYIVESVKKITIFDDNGSSIPLYVENLIIVESKTITDMNTEMKRTEFLLLKLG